MTIVESTPKMLAAHLASSRAQKKLTYTRLATQAGCLWVFQATGGIYKALFSDQQVETSDHEYTNELSKSLLVAGTPFQLKIWRCLRENLDQLWTYQQLAIAVGHPTAWRAVANTVGANPIAYFIPCHNVIRSDGSLGGYRWGVEKKRLLFSRKEHLKP